MVQLSAEQLLQIAFTLSAAAVAVIAGVFLLVLRATHLRRGLGWFCGWAFTALTFALLAAAHSEPRLEMWCGFAATCAAIIGGSCGVIGACDFRNLPRVSPFAVAVLVLSAAASLYIQWTSNFLGDLTAVEIPLMASVVLQAAVLLPMARTTRMSGVQTACAALIVLSVMLARTVVCWAILNAQGKQLTELYWSFEMIGGVILSFVLAIGELIALIDEIRVELERSNDALNEALQGLEVAAKLDPLTGLYNRYAFYTLINEFMERGNVTGSIAIIDLNGLKRINDTFGHHAGDRALLNLAMRLQEAVRQTDYVFRWGGDEFVLLLFGMPPDAARERVAHFPPPAPLEFDDRQPVQLTLSWGVAPLEADVDAALRAADEQLYAQKRLFTRAAGKLSNT